MANLTIEHLKRIYALRGLKLYDDGRVNFAAFRSKNRVANAFDDRIYLIRRAGTNFKKEPIWDIFSYRCTVDPGCTRLQNPTFDEAIANGTAIVCEGQTVRIGWSNIGKGEYNHKCFKQADPIRVYRDKNRDGILDMVNPETGFYAICDHCFANYGETERVNNRSAGCTDYFSFQEYLLMIKYCEKYIPVGGHAWKSYFLEEDITATL